MQNWFRSVYGQSRTRRGQVLTHINARYEDYRNLPEEIDAWNLGDGAGSEVEAKLGNGIKYPNVQDWKTLTGRKWHFRSGIVANDGLRRVDAAIGVYQNARNPTNRAALRQTFMAWYQANPKESLKRNVCDVGDPHGCVEKLRTWLA